MNAHEYASKLQSAKGGRDFSRKPPAAEALAELALEGPDASAESKPLPENTTTSGSRWTHPLSLNGHAKPRIRPAVIRERDEVPGNLWAAIVRCAAGELPWPLLVYGGVGTGKTCAGLVLCDYLAGSAIYRDFVTLCAEHQSCKMGAHWWYGTHGETRVSPEYYWQNWNEMQLAILDEIGAREVASDHVYETLKRALDERDRKPLMLISNLSPQRIAEVFDDRIASRCVAGTVINLAGDDRRLTRQ